MAEKPAPRSPKSRSHSAEKGRDSGARRSPELTALARIERKLDETREQMAFMYGVLEEISQRQTVQAAWQLDWAKTQQALLDPPPEESPDAAGPVSPEALNEIAHAADSLLKRIEKARSRERVKGLRKAEKVLNRTRPTDEENTLVVIPGREEIH